MAKLPDNFVKAPSTSRLTLPKTAAPKESRRGKRGGLPTAAEVAAEANSVLVRLSPEELSALQEACAALAAVGETVTVEDMIKQVVGRWMATRQSHVEPATPPAQPRATVVEQLRRLAEQPLRHWRAIGQTLQVWSRVFAK
jgi:hypothetical protein